VTARMLLVRRICDIVVIASTPQSVLQVKQVYIHICCVYV
jgi:hypothetical protein